jgi:hypothetical protein
MTWRDDPGSKEKHSRLPEKKNEEKSKSYA